MLALKDFAFQNVFVRFIRTRGWASHFHRITVLDGAHKTSATSKASTGAHNDHLLWAARATQDTLLSTLESHPEGLSPQQAARIRARVGENVFEQDKPLPWYLHLWHCYKTPFDLLLTLLAVVSYLTDDIKATLVIGSMVVLSVGVRFWQERKSSKAAEKLKALVSNRATVYRRDESAVAQEEAQRYFQVRLTAKPAYREEVPIQWLVPGDVIHLSAGDMIPADCRVLVAKDLFVAQAAMTGESLPVEKSAVLDRTDTPEPLEMDNLVFMGTNVVSGTATAVVVATGARTHFGALAERVTQQDRAPTQFQAGVNKVAWLLIRFMLVMSPTVFLINGWSKGDWLEAFLFAVSIAVGLTPEMLPMIVTSTLAKGAVALSRQKVIVKRLEAIQNFGAMDVLCTDKTGTLTQDKIFLSRHTDVWGQESDEVLQAAYLNSAHQTGLKNLLDVAVLEYADQLPRDTDWAGVSKVDEIPFDFQRRRMSVVLCDAHGQHQMICKGAVEEVLQVCSRAHVNGQEQVLSADMLDRVRRVTADLNEEGLRVVAVARKQVPAQGVAAFGVADESDMVLLGYVAFLDPPKESTAPALAALAEHGVAVKVLTGDNDKVTAKICSQVGLPVGEVLLGSALERMDAHALAQAVQSHTVFAKLTPVHKERIVQALRAQGHVVGFMGDGINDAPALRAADIGISVDSAVDIAKEAADIILLEKSLMVLEHGVMEGRKTFANMLKYIKMTASSNFGNVFSVLIASAFLPFLPMLPMHLLLQNLLYDLSQVAIPFDRVDDEQVRSPQRWNPSDIGRFMVWFGPVSSVFDVLTFVGLWYVLGAQTLGQQTLFQSGWFLEGLMTQTVVVHMIRTARVPFVQSRAAGFLLFTSASILALGVGIVMGPWAHAFKLQALPMSYFIGLIAVLIGYMVVVQAIKRVYIRRYGWQ